MSSPNPIRRVPQVNLLVREPGPQSERNAVRRYVEWTLMALVVVIWAAVGVAIALVLGWHPDLGP